MIKIFSISVCLLLFFARFNLGDFRSVKAAANRSAIQTKTNLVIQADLYFGDEDEQKEPVEADFYLLDESLINILKKAKFKPVFPDGEKHRAKDEDYLEAAAKGLLSQPGDDGEAEVLAFLINEAIERHQSSFARTKQTGRGYFKAIEAGNYYLFGIKEIDGQVVVWHLPVVVKPGGNLIELDQNNAATVFSAA